MDDTSASSIVHRHFRTVCACAAHRRYAVGDCGTWEHRCVARSWWAIVRGDWPAPGYHTKICNGALQRR